MAKLTQLAVMQLAILQHSFTHSYNAIKSCIRLVVVKLHTHITALVAVCLKTSNKLTITYERIESHTTTDWPCINNKPRLYKVYRHSYYLSFSFKMRLHMVKTDNDNAKLNFIKTLNINSVSLFLH